MNISEEEKVKEVNKLIEISEKNSHTKYEKINTVNEYLAAKITYSTIIKTARGFKKAARNCWTQYTNSLLKSIDNIELLFSFSKLSKCAEYYSIECKNLKSVIKEYEYHMLNGNLTSALLGYDRRDYE